MVLLVNNTCKISFNVSGFRVIYKQTTCKLKYVGQESKDLGLLYKSNHVYLYDIN